MRKALFRFSIFVGCLALASLAATAQEIVHALIGSVSEADPNSTSIWVDTDDGTEGHFKDLPGSNAKIPFDKDIRSDATAASDFKKSGERVIVYFVGSDTTMRTAVALRSLGPGPFTKTTGVVVQFDHGHHSFSIKDASGKVTSFKIAKDTVAETVTGAHAEFDFHFDKGDRLRINSALVNGEMKVLFINTLATR